ncbi:hypothetical protein FS837_012864 [Tulasnella sp. UAMH 9824]|nr:hypothetical protein FS837_012864 [Tulasnella sp. UAMH 9824]
MYHKPCLSCKSCSKRLDSYSLVEHDSEPYCKQCHIRNFSTKDLRHANLPQASPPTSPSRTSTGSAPTSPNRIPTSPGKLNLANLASPKRDLEEDTPVEPPPQPFSFPPVAVPEPIPEEKEEPEVLPQEPKPAVEAVAKSPSPPPKRFSIYSRRPMSPTFTGSGSPISTSQPLSPNFTGRGTGSPITPNFTGQGVFGAPKKLTPNFTGGVWSGGNKDQCPKCGKAVYHAEGINAVGKRWHKACLRCSECGRSLDSTRLTDRDGEPYCKACYAKLYGPQGSGYALLGKVG